MATHHDKPGSRLRQTQTLNPATADTLSDDETPWQQLMVFNYLLFETIDALEQERHSRQQPLNQSWQHFVSLLRSKKPRLGVCLDRLLRDGFFDELGGVQ